ncbi:MAG: MFS transporter [Hyphomicrobiales bacterium]|nr:MAG: MFS transporter [Hyphomicrobiales bacterium]
MAPSDRAEGFSPELRASLFHFTVFASTGASSAYFAIWLSGKGITPDQIGIINAVPVLLLLLASMVIGRLADRASDWRVAIIILAAIAGLASFGFLFVSEFWGALLVFALCSMPAGAMVPIVDAATLRMTERRGTDFGFVRAWGTVGYTITAALTGALIGWLGAAVFVPLFIVLSLLRTGLAFQLPRFRAPEHVEAPVRKPGGATLRSLIVQPWFVLPCIAFALIQATHFFLGAMGALVWKIDGIGEGWFGPLIAISAAGEAVTMFFWRKIGGRMTARTMLIIAGVVAAGRWFAMAFSPSLPVLFALQALHAITLPFSYFGIMHFIANWAPEEIAAEAQSFSSALTQGFAVLTLLAFGWLVGIMGGQAYFVAAGMAVLGVLAAWWSLLLKPAHGHTDA